MNRDHLPGDAFSTLPVRAVRERPGEAWPRGQWPATIPAIRQVLDDGLEPASVTVLSGENGSGKSTLLEAIAHAFGIDAEGGSTDTVLGATRDDACALGEHLQVARGIGASRRGLFLRAEAMFGHFTYLERANPAQGRLHRMSHGESFLEYLGTTGARYQGLWILDEPEAALSLSGCLALVRLLDAQARRGTQVIISTHSPILAHLPGALCLELDAHGMQARPASQLELTRTWSGFMHDPQRVIAAALDDEQR